MTDPARESFVGHYLSESCRIALCGERDPVLDLRPTDGRIDCEPCKILRSWGYSCVRSAPRLRRFLARAWARFGGRAGR